MQRWIDSLAFIKLGTPKREQKAKRKGKSIGEKNHTKRQVGTE